MATLHLTHTCFVDHDTGFGHPERPDRMRAIDQVLGHTAFDDLVREEAPQRDDFEEAALRAHPQSYIDAVRASAPEPGGASVRLDADTVMSPGTWEAVCRSVGAGLRAVDQVIEPGNGISNAFCQVRPPGHHAEAVRAMGFCLFNNVAIAAHYARVKHGAERVAVVDFDVHHGNGTQDIFWSDPDLLYCSTHEMPLYPGTGAASETGVGNIVNAPLRSGDDGEAFRDATESRILPALDAFRPDLIIISAGFDAHEADPLAGLRLIEADFSWVTQALIERADRHCDGRIVSMLEGGYDLTALAKSTAVHVKALMGA